MRLMVRDLRSLCLMMVLGFCQRFLKLLALLIPKTDISPRDEATGQKDHGQKNERHQQSDTGKNQEAVEAAQSYGEYYSHSLHGK